MLLAKYLGKHISYLLDDKTFKHWSFKQEFEDDLAKRIIFYVFDGYGMELRCDSNDIVNVIFVYAEELGGFNESLIEFSFSLTRESVRKHFGVPAKYSEKVTHPILGDSGPWDRFICLDSVIHFEYKMNASGINRITLMQTDGLL